MRKGVFVIFILFLVFCVVVPFINADVFSVNSGGNGGLIINPDEYLEGFFFQENSAPIVSNLLLYSVPYNTNTTNENLTISYSSSDENGDVITNISDWRLNGNSIAVLNMPFDTKINAKTTGAVRDYSTYENNGTLGGGNVSRMPVWNSSGKIGGAYQFDGVNDYIDNPDIAIGTSSFTISAWIKWANGTRNDKLIDCGGLNQIQGLLLKRDTTYTEFYYQVTPSIITYIPGGVAALGGNIWHHLVYTSNRTFDSLYIDGSLFFGGAKDSSSVSLSFKNIGGYGIAQSVINYYKGTMDELKIYNRALTPEQIKADYLTGVAGHSTETIVSQETNVGETWQVAMTANDAWFDSVTVLSNNLTIVNNPPINPNPLLVSMNGRNETNSNLNCSFNVLDVDSFNLNVTVDWIKDEDSQLNLTYNNIANGTFYSSILNSNNLTLGDIWKCSVRYYDGYAYSNWIDSNELEIIDITSPNITIISPEPINYTNLSVTFNVSLNENGSVCNYNLDNLGNLSMTKLNETYFWTFDETLGPGEHNITFYCNDTSNNWGTNSTNFTIQNEAAIAILLSDELSWSVKWNVLNLPVDDLNAEGNNFNDSTDYYINVSATNTLVDVYVKADDDLYTIDLDMLPLENENYTISLSDPNVTGIPKSTMITNYTLIADGIGNASTIYMKFYLDAPSSQAAGTYYNTLSFKAVRHGQLI